MSSPKRETHMTTRFTQWVAAAFVAVVAPLATPVAAGEPSKTTNAAAEGAIKSFLGTYCTECHGAEKQKGDRRFDQLSFPASSADTLFELQDILDQLNLGEMPPEKAKRHPEAKEVREIVGSMTQLVAEGHTRLVSTGGRTVLRRLNRREYINTVGDLFGLNMTMFDPTTKFPADQMVMHMDNVGDALRTSSYLLDQYLDAADQVVEKAFRAQQRPPEKTWTFKGDFHQQEQLDRNQSASADPFRYLEIYETPKSFKHNGAYGPLLAFAEGVPADGFYEIKVKAEAMNRHHSYDPAFFSPMDPEEPFRLGIVPGDQKAGWLHYPQHIEPVLAETALGDKGPEWHTFKVWLDAGYTPRFIFPNGMMSVFTAFPQVIRHDNESPAGGAAERKGAGGQRAAKGKRNAEGRGDIEARRSSILTAYAKTPHIRIHEVLIRGPLYDQWPPAGPQVILGGKPFEAGRTREILETFASRAYRRPALADEVDRLVAIVAQRGKDGKSPLDALKDGLKAVLCSPAFLYLAESEPEGELATIKGRALSAHARASRLSYFLSSTMPDAELAALAHSGELLKPPVLAAQTRRLLASPRSEAFVKGFLDSWLNLRSLGDMPPPEGPVFEHYYARDLEGAMRRETQLFTRYLIDHNESIVRFLDSDFTFVNRPLAKLYGMGDLVGPVDGHEFRMVKITNPSRGGLLGQASVLTVSANGIETSPVVRGIWLLENILGTTPPPPPDNVPPIDPDVRGARTMREILTKHRENPSCFECHRKIDPLGFALENFDPVGAWRSNYEKIEQINNRKVNRIVGALIDTSGELPGGQSFKDVAGLKKVLIERKDQFARTLTERLLGYACGRRMEPMDRPEVNRIVKELAVRGYGFKDLIELVTMSTAFQSK